MDTADPLWQQRPMRDALARGDTGAVVRLARQASGIKLSELGEAVGYTAASLSRMERGRQPLRDITLLRHLAVQLDIPPHLLGLAGPHDPATPPRSTPARPGTPTKVCAEPIGEEGEDPVRRRKLLALGAGITTSTILGGNASAAAGPATPGLSGLEDVLLYRQPAIPSNARVSVGAIEDAVEAARRDFTTCRYDRLARALPGRIALAQALADGGDHEHGQAAAAGLYNLATRLCIKLGEDELAAVTADRALTAARAGADALTVAEAHRMVSSAWRRAGHHHQATTIAVTAAEHLAADRTADKGARLSAVGNLYATAAYTAAKADDRTGARDLIREAKKTADQLGADAIAGGQVFGPTQVALHQISVSYLLGDAGQAIEHARSINPATLPTTERQARYCIDVARAYHQWGKPDRCYRALLAAEKAAPEEVRRASVRTMAGDLMRHDRTLPGVRAFTARVGALA